MLSMTYARLENSINYKKTKGEIILTNQEGETFKRNSGSKQSRRHFNDGGIIHQNSKDYYIKYSFDFKPVYNPMGSGFEFSSFKGIAGNNLLNFINELQNSDSEKFIWINELNFMDTRKELFKKEKVTIANTDVDGLLIQILSKYFKKIKQIEFSNCKILEFCNFSALNNISISFESTLIINFSIFSLSNNTYTFRRCEILKISPSRIFSKSITFFDCIVNFKDIFLKCDFNKLLELTIDAKNPNTYYGNDFLYLGYSAPNLENLRILGKFDNVYFLSRLCFLLKLSIAAIFDNNGLEYAHVVNKSIYLKYMEKYKDKIELDRLLIPDLGEEYLVAQKEIEHQIRIASFYRTLLYTKDEEKALKKMFDMSNSNPIYTKQIQVEDGHYLTDYNALYFVKQEPYDFLHKSNCYHSYKNYIYTSMNDNRKNEIVRTQKFVLYIDSHPIILLNKYRKRVTSIEDATKLMVQNSEKFDLNRNDFESIIRALKENSYDQSNLDISLNSFIDGVQITSDSNLKLTSKKVIEYLKNQKITFAYKLEKDVQHKQTYNAIRDKNINSYAKIMVEIASEFDNLSFEQKSYLSHQIRANYYGILRRDLFKEVDKINIDNIIIKKYLNILRQTSRQLGIFYKCNDNLTVTSYDLKQLQSIILP